MKAAETEEPRPGHLVLDTHVLIWLMFGDVRLGRSARARIDQAAKAGEMLVSAITPWEIGILVGKRRIDLQRDVMAWVAEALALPGVTLAALEPEIAVESTRLPFTIHADPADRILVATARQLGATLVTADRDLLGIAKKGHLKAMNAAR